MWTATQPVITTPCLLDRQAAGIRFISFRNEQAAGYAAAAAGFLTGTPAALLTVSGPGVLHGLPGLAHATVNAWPMLHIAGSAAQVRNCTAFEIQYG
jgi:thiamine pyrophosphate-dependent acetolactate synthase large subunit-like protein